MSIAEYERKRDFSRTQEPKGKARQPSRWPSSGRPRFVVQKHAARRLHFDLRLESEGTLLSWAVPKGPSLDPNDKRLAVKVEDHPLEYASFEGTIPKGEYGAGTVMVWDTGHWTPKEEDVAKALKRGRLSFTLAGQKLCGDWHLTRMGGLGEGDKDNWLLIKSHDDYAVGGDGESLLREQATSALSGRTLEAIAAGEAPPATTAPDRLLAARKAGALPLSLTPQLATLAEAPPGGDDWIHEIKYDGYRLLAFCSGDGTVKLKTRNGKDWTAKFPTLQSAIQSLGLESCALDGELIAIAKNGVSDFQSLQNALKERSGEAALRYMVFDLPFASGYDLRHTPLLERKRLLKSILGPATDSSVARYSDHVQGNGSAVFSNACKLQLEGIISKRANSPYVSKRSRDWLKVKCNRRQEFIVCGFTEPSGSREGFGALHLGYYESEQLVYAGKVGTGFNERLLKRLREQFESLAIESSPLSNPPANERGTTWIKPEPVAEIKYTEQTKDGLLRHPVFLGLREDKPARSVALERPRPLAQLRKKPASKTKPAPAPAGSRKSKAASKSSGAATSAPRLTNPDRVLYPKIGATKQRLAHYYETVADAMLPYVANRPLALLRHPKGWQDKGFFHKHIDQTFPEAVRRVSIEESGGASVYGYVNSAEGLVGLLQMGVLEIHTWGSRVDAVEKPDLLVMDLDPDEDLPSAQVVGAALLLRDLLQDRANLKSYLKTTGGKGLHVVVPLRRGPSWEEVKRFSKAVAEALRELNPGAFLTTASKQKRKGKIYIDYLRNGRGATAIAPYSTRAREGAPVSVPLSWDEATSSLKSSFYTIENVARRLAQLKTDPWAGYSRTRQSLSKAAKAAFDLS